MAEIRWIKLRIDMFDDEKIKIIQSMPEGDAILVIWIRIIALAGKCNSNGLVLVEDEFPYTDEMLSVIFGKPLSTVKLALATFEKLRMIENTDKGIYITNFDRHQNIEGMDRIREQNRVRKQRERERKRALLFEESGSAVPALPDGDPDQNTEVTDLSRDRSREVTQQREKEEKDNNNISISSNENIDIVGGTSADGDDGPDSGRKRIDYQHIMADFHATCIDFPTICAMSEARKKKVRTLLNEFEKLKIWPDVTIYDRLHRLFVMAQDSDFLSGRDQKWRGCSFDWIINKANALKIVEGNYMNSKGGVNHEKNGRADAGNTGGNSGAGNKPLEGTTRSALERFRRNGGIGDGPQMPEVP